MKRERITITIDHELIPAIDALVDGEAIRNRSHALEVAARRGLAVAELGAVFFIYRNTSTIEIPQLAAALATIAPPQWYCISATPDMPAASLWMESLAQSMKEPPKEKMVVPGDFGTAAAILLHKDRLPPHFLIIDLGMVTTPDTLLSAYIHHRAHSHIVTSFLRGDGLTYQALGWHLATRSLTEHIPAGFASLETGVFPTLAKAGRISTYVSGS